MESSEQSESDVAVTADADRSGWKSPLRWPAIALAGIKQGPGLLLDWKNYRRWTGQFFAFVWANKVMSMVVVLSGLAMVLPLATFFAYREVQQHLGIGVPVKAEDIVVALERGDFAQTKILSRRFMGQKGTPKSEMGVAPFALGMVAAFEAEKLKGKDRQRRYLLAARYLEQAEEAGFPAVHRAEGFFLYGKSLYETGEFTKCRRALIEAMKIAPQHKAEVYRLLANAYLNESNPKLTEAMTQNAAYLSDGKLSAADREYGILQKSRLELRMDKLNECRATLKEIPENSKAYASAMIISGQALMREGELFRAKGSEATKGDVEQSREKYQEAIKTLRLAESHAVAGSEAMRMAMYYIGVCFMEMGDRRAANDQFRRTRKIAPDSAEGSAAWLQEAELSRRAGQEMEMLSEYRRVLGGLDRSVPYHNPLVLPDELKSRLMSTYQEYTGKQRYEICMQLIGLMKAIMPEDQTRLMQAELHATWAQQLSSSAEKAARNKREAMRRLAREEYRRAGRDYAAAAKLYIARREYPDQLWNAATSYFQGHDYRQAVDMLRAYLKEELQRRRPQALESLGESLLCLGEYDAALESLRECIELYPRDAAACHARVLAAQALREKNDIPGVEKMLLANLNGDYLTPASKEWRESLLMLGDLLHSMGRYAEAARRLEEAVKRYPDSPETPYARYLLADCRCRLAYALRDELKKNPSGDSNGVQESRIHEDFAKALEQYRVIQEKLGGNRDPLELSASEKAVLRNSLFAIGDVLYAEGDYEAAIKAYQIAANRYQNRPEVLDAYVQMSNAYYRLGKPEDAYNALQQAKLLLARLKPDVSFAETSVYSREQWDRRLDEMLARGAMKG